MSTIPQGRKARFIFDGVDVTGIGHGLDRITRTQARDYERIAGLRGIAAGQLGPYILHDFNFACASNTVHDPALQAANGIPTEFHYEPQAGEGLRYTAMAVPSILLSLDPRTDAAVWGVQMAVDGSPTTSPAPADDRVAGPISRYKVQGQVAVTYAGIDLYPHWHTALTVQGAANPSRERLLPVPPATVVGITADPQDIGYTARIGLRFNDVVLAAIDANPQGPLIVTRTNAAWVSTIPMCVASIADTAPSTGAYTVDVDFRQFVEGLPTFEPV